MHSIEIVVRIDSAAPQGVFRTISLFHVFIIIVYLMMRSEDMQTWTELADYFFDTFDWFRERKDR